MSGIKDIIKERKIYRLFHFTQAENLDSIFKNGILPRDQLKDKDIASCINDPNRFDNQLDAVCMSVGHPNYKMFYKLREDNPEKDWVVLLLKPWLLCDLNCAFCWTNAADATVTNIPIEKRTGDAAFAALFEDRPGFPQRGDLHLQDYMPTNPQAEILVRGSIQVRYILGVHFNDQETFNKYKHLIPQSVKGEVSDQYFKPRFDNIHWR